MITVGSYAIIQKLDSEICKLVKITRNYDVLVDNLKVKLNGAIDKRFGLFEVQNGNLSVMSNVSDGGLFLSGLRSNLHGSEPRKRVIERDDEEDAPPIKVTGQLITSKEIDDLKCAGASVKEVVSTLASGNTNFEARTTHAQDKYLTKKTKIHNDKVYILKPTLRLITKALYLKNHERICSLRMDVFANMMYLANVVPGSRVLVYDEVHGLVIAALLQRLEGKGELYVVYNSFDVNNLLAVHAMGFKPEFLNVLRPIRWNIFNKAIAGVQLDKSTQLSEDEPMECEGDNFKEPSADQQFIWAYERVVNVSAMDSLLFVGDSVNATDFLKNTFKSVRKSGSIVVHTNIESDALTLVSYLESETTVDINVQRLMCRRMQAIQDRCHPVLMEYMASGTLINATKVGL